MEHLGYSNYIHNILNLSMKISPRTSSNKFLGFLGFGMIYIYTMFDIYIYILYSILRYIYIYYHNMYVLVSQHCDTSQQCPSFCDDHLQPFNH